MTDYTKTTNFASKDALPSGNANKIVKGTEINTEFDNIATAVTTKANIANPAFTGVVSFPDGSASNPSITNTGDTNAGLFFSAADTLAFSAGGTAQVVFADGVISPVTDSDVDLGTNSLRFKDAYVDSVTVTGNGAITGDLDVDGTIEFDALSGTGSVAITDILDEDDMASNSATALATQQSIKAYVIAQQDTVDSLSEVLALGNTTGDTDISVTDDTKVQFRDSAIYINSSADGQLDIVADTEIQIAATTVDINGAVALNGAVTGATNVTLSGELDAATGDFSGAVDIDGALDVAGTTNLDVVDIDGATQIDATVSVGVDDTGYDVKFFGATSGKSLLWDESADSLIVTGTTTMTGNSTVSGTLGVTGVLTGTSLDISGDIDVDGTTNLDVVDIDGAVDMASTLTVTGEITANGGIALGDSDKATFGAGDDLQIYHDGSNSYVKDAGTGTLNLQGSTQVLIAGANGTVGVQFVEGGGVNLRHNNSQKLSTTSAGIQVTGNIANASGNLTLDVAGDIILDADGGDIQFKDGGTEFGRVFGSSNNFYIQARQSDKDIIFQGIDGSSTISALTLDMSAAGAATFNAGVTAVSGVFKNAADATGTTIKVQDNADRGITITSPISNGAAAGRIATSGTANSLEVGVRDYPTALTIAGGSGAATFSSRVGIGTAPTDSLLGSDYGTTLLHIDGGSDRGQVIIEGDVTSQIVMSDNAATANSRVFITQVNDGLMNLKSVNDNGTSKATFMSATSDGEVTMPSQPAFSAIPAGDQNNIAINTVVTVVFGTERFDVGANFASNTFTAPVAGKYSLHAHLRLTNIDTSAAYYMLRITTSNEEYQSLFTSTQFANDVLYWPIAMNCLADMDANDTAVISIYQSNGSAQSDINTESYFNGILVA